MRKFFKIYSFLAFALHWAFIATGQGCPVPSLATAYPIGPTVVNPQWYASPGQVFELQYRVVGNSAWITIHDIEISNYAGSYSISELRPATPYEWRVRRVCDPANLSDYSFVGQFQTAACLPPTKIQQLSANLGTSAINLGWTNDNVGSLEYATTTYNYRWRTAGGSWQQGNSVFKSCVIEGLTSGTPYEVQVQTACSADELSAYSPSYTFSTHPCPAYILNTVPRRGPTSARFLTSFEYGNGQGSFSFDTYLLQWRVSYSADPWQQKLVTGNIVPVEGVFAPGTSYEYRIVLGCGASSQQDPSYFQTGSCQNYVNFLASQPSVSTLPGLVQFRWSNNTTTEMAVFVLRYRELDAPAWTYHTDIPASSVENHSPLNLYDLKSDTHYEWQIATRCGPEYTSSFTDSGIFLTSTEPVGAVNYTRYASSWNNVSAWSLGRIPNRRDVVELRHPMLIPVSYTALTGTLQMGTLGRFFCDPQGNARWLIFGTN
jgi:trimeric autotransporter adhesin